MKSIYGHTTLVYQVTHLNDNKKICKTRIHKSYAIASLGKMYLVPGFLKTKYPFTNKNT